MDHIDAVTNPEELTNLNEFDSVDVEDLDEPFKVKVIRFLRLCIDRRRTVYKVVSLGAALSVLISLVTPKVYTATTVLMPPDNSSPYEGVMSILSSQTAMLASQALGLQSQGELFVRILKSRNVEDGLISRFDLHKYYEAKLNEVVRKRLEANTTIGSDVKSGAITIVVTDKNPQFAADLANGYVHELNRVVAEDSTSSARRERLFLEGRVKEIKSELDEASQALSQFSTKSKTIDLPSQAKSMVEQGSKLEAELIEARGQLAGLREIYSENNARVKAAEARLGELQHQMNAMGGLASANGSTDIADNSPYPTAAALPKLGLTYYDLERTVKVDEALWENLTKEYEIAKVEEAKSIPTVRVLDPAIAPERKTSPHRSVMVLVGAFISLIISLLLIAASEYWEKLDEQDETKKFLRQIANSVPMIRKKRAALLDR